jgi:hypothetical protein
VRACQWTEGTYREWLLQTGFFHKQLIITLWWSQVSPAPVDHRFVGVNEDMCKFLEFRQILTNGSHEGPIEHSHGISQKHEIFLSLIQGLQRLWNTV